MNKSLLFLAFALSLTLKVLGQSMQFSLYPFSSSLVNPARINQNNRVEANGIFRSQGATAGTTLSNAYLDVSYPLFKGHRRWSSVGLAFSTDRSGLGGIFQTDEAFLNYAVTAVLSRPHILSVGTSIRYANASINTQGLTTGSQFVDGIGFDRDLPSGEVLNDFNNRHVSTSIGAHWKVIDKTQTMRSMLGISVSDVNRPRSSFTDQTSLPVTTQIEAAYRLSYSKRTTHYVEILHLHSRAIRSSIVGLRTDVNLYRFNRQLKGQRLQVVSKYRWNEAVVFGLVWKNRELSVGTSYDVPVGNRISHQGAFEIAVSYSKLRRPKNRRSKGKTTRPLSPRSHDTDSLTSLVDYTDYATNEEQEEHHPTPNEPSYELDIERPILLHFRFEFGSAEPAMLEEGLIEAIAEILNENPTKTIVIVGHTDSVGGTNVNQELSFERAQSMYDLLIALGVNPFQMSVDGKGEREPVSTNKTPEGRALNRRVEIIFQD